jgi:hypothetical protein
MANGDTTSLGDYLVLLGEDREALEAYIKNPERAMREAGVSETDRDVILSGNVEEIKKAVQERLGESAALIVYVPIVHPPIVYY